MDREGLYSTKREGTIRTYLFRVSVLFASRYDLISRLGLGVKGAIGKRWDCGMPKKGHYSIAQAEKIPAEIPMPCCLTSGGCSLAYCPWWVLLHTNQPQASNPNYLAQARTLQMLKSKDLTMVNNLRGKPSGFPHIDHHEPPSAHVLRPVIPSIRQIEASKQEVSEAPTLLDLL